MAIHKLYQGGNRANYANNQMLPSGTSPVSSNPPYSYADHQRARHYSVTRQFDLRSAVPFGGGGKDQALVEYFRTNPVAVGDVLHTNLLLASSVLQGVSYGVVSPLPGFTFNIVTVNTPHTLASVNAGVAPVNASGKPKATYLDMLTPAVLGTPYSVDDEDYLALVVTAVPAGGILPAATGGLRFWITAHVLDLENGNA